MNEITLSDNLQQIELEINWHKENVGKSIWEIGRRLNHVKENDLAHGKFMEWYQGLGLDKDFVSKSMKIANELPNFETLRNLGTTALYLIATLPKEEKQEQLEKVEQGDTPTVRELQEVRRKLKESEERNKRLEEQALKQEVIEKEIKRLEDDSHEAITLKETVESLRTDKEKLEGTYKNAMELSSLLSEFENFFDEKMAPLRFKAVIVGLGTEFQLKKLRDMLTLVDSWLTEMNKIVPDEGRKIIEGEIING